jgi:hypothetical protein
MTEREPTLLEVYAESVLHVFAIRIADGYALMASRLAARRSLDPDIRAARIQ